jgi:hypothetical protein
MLNLANCVLFCRLRPLRLVGRRIYRQAACGSKTRSKPSAPGSIPRLCRCAPRSRRVSCRGRSLTNDACAVAAPNYTSICHVAGGERLIQSSSRSVLLCMLLQRHSNASCCRCDPLCFSPCLAIKFSLTVGAGQTARHQFSCFCENS